MLKIDFENTEIAFAGKNDKALKAIISSFPTNEHPLADLIHVQSHQLVSKDQITYQRTC